MGLEILRNVRKREERRLMDESAGLVGKKSCHPANTGEAGLS